MKGGRALLAGMVALLAGLVAFLFVRFADDGGGRGGLEVGLPRAAACTEAAPACLPSLTFVATDGTALPPEALAGKVVVVNVWATWCGPCLAEIPDLARTYARYKDKGVVLIGVLTDEPSEQKLDAFVRETGINYPIVRADPEVMRQLDYPEELPTTLIYDGSGHLRSKRRGALSSEQLEGALDDLLPG